MMAAEFGLKVGERKHRTADYFSISQTRRATVVHMRNSVDALNFADSIEQVRRFVITNRPKRLLLNLSDVHFLQTSALAKLGMLDDELSQVGGTLKVCGLRPQLADVLSSMRVLPALTVEVDEQHALAGWNGPDSTIVEPRSMPSVEETSRKPAGECITRRSAEGQWSAEFLKAISGPRQFLKAFADSLLTLWAVLCVYFKQVVLAVAVLSGAVYFQSGHVERQAITVCGEIYAQRNQLQQEGATARQWAQLQSRARREMEPLIQQLSTQGDKRSEVESNLLSAMRCLIIVIDEAPESADEDEQDFLRHFEKASQGVPINASDRDGVQAE